ncbi:tyrosinase family protein [Sphingomonas canadensis]|uniref:Tyrosinase family protein n=1 Tax=Sphingomonas canadensis TaxID=1219257 RepID=A0ABW3H6J2_9SPHN|nr:tyrosinase family protein [Sphingomonas canadensis]MCW3835553.1 tyrosinase family protein [Sphingomonas canadensis]
MIDRRGVLAVLALMGSGAAFARAVPELPGVRPREPWNRFAKGPMFAPFVKAIARLKREPNIESADSWLFWANIHATHCPHGKPYFLAWHRGYLALFERKLAELTGNGNFRLPYWDYYRDPRVPEEVTRGDAATNPLWEPRKGSTIAPALGFTAYDPGLGKFERGVGNSFESRIEASPHNNIHNLVGGRMATMQSPQDIVFWLHHANVDRLWAAWLASGHAGAMPPESASYWAGRFAYTGTMDLAKADTIACERLGYRYEDLVLPSQAPPVEMAAPADEAPVVGAPPPVTAGDAEGGSGRRPPRKATRSRAPRPAAAPPAPVAAAPPPPQVMPDGSIALGSDPVLASATFAVEMPVVEEAPIVGAPAPAPRKRTRRGAPRAPAAAAPPPPAAAPPPPPPEAMGDNMEGGSGMRPGHSGHGAQDGPPGPDQLVLVLNDVSLTAAGAEGGYFFRIYANLPGMGPVQDDSRLIGTIGPFQIAAAMHNAVDGKVRLELPVTDVVRRLRDENCIGSTALDLAFVRVDAEDAPGGQVIAIGRYSIEGVLTEPTG